MKPIIVKIIAGVGTAAVLGGGGYMLWRFLRKRKDERLENAALEVEYIFDRKEADEMLKDAIESDPRSHREPVVRDEDDPGSDETDISKEKMANGLKQYMIDAEAKENFEKYLAGLENPEEPDEDPEDDEEDIHRGADGPYVISAGEFCNTRSYYDKVSVNYFQKDDIVADDRDEVLENAHRILGDLQSAFRDPDAPAILYIRNEPLEVDYEVSLVEGSYRREILHLDEEG